jgi:hypothetical protein
MENVPTTGTESQNPVYQASSTKRRRVRATNDQMEKRRAAILDIIEDMHPMTVRQVFYAATVRGLIEKTEGGYAKVLRELTLMRRSGELPYEWLADSTRLQRKPKSFLNAEHAVSEVAKFYRRNLWANADAYVEVWIEKDALSGVVYPVTSKYDVPLMVARGYASLSFLHSAAEYISELSVPAYIYHFGDHDPSGQDAAQKIERELRKLSYDAEIYFRRMAVTPEQIRTWNLPTRPTKASDPQAKKFGNAESVELDAIEPGRLRELVEGCIEQHIDPDELAVTLEAEKSEKELLTALGLPSVGQPQ